MAKKDGRFSPGNERAAKLTDTKVYWIRTMYVTGEMTQGELSRRTGVSVGQIGRICRGESWQHVPMPPNDREIAKSQREFALAMGITEDVQYSAEMIEKLRKPAQSEATPNEDPIEKYYPRNTDK